MRGERNRLSPLAPPAGWAHGAAPYPTDIRDKAAETAKAHSSEGRAFTRSSLRPQVLPRPEA
jgi:hypothetical protein